MSTSKQGATSKLAKLSLAAGRYSRSAGVKAVLTVIAVLALGLLTTSLPRAFADESPVGSKSAIPRSQLGSEALCPVVGTGAHCLAEAAISADGVPVIGAPAVSTGYGPAEYHTAYKLPCEPGGAVKAICSSPSQYGPEIVAITESGSFAGLEASLNTYNQYYGLPACTVANGCLTIVNQDGATSPLPPPDSNTGWATETALDVEAVHMICQTCKIVVVDADNSSVDNLTQAIATAASFNPIAISNSWGASGDITSLDSQLVYPGIAVLAATGDNGTNHNVASWPSDNPDVIAVSGTTLNLNSDKTWASETVWSGSGGGCNNVYSAPAWQASIYSGCGAYRASGDVSADANPSTGMAVYIDGSGWVLVGGTSLATPLVASIFALASGVPTATGAVTVPYHSFTSTNSHDIVSGNDCTSWVQNCTAAVGFDTPSGLGSPNGIGGFVAQPLKPATPAPQKYDKSSVQLSWAPTTGAFGVSGYRIYRDGVQIGTSATNSYLDTGLRANTPYDYYLVAYDSTGGLSLDSGSTAVTTYYEEDINEDKHVDLLDFSLLADKFGDSGGSLGRVDINGDNSVDLLDFSLLADNFNVE